MGTRKERRRERTRMRNDGKERDTEIPRESFKPSRGRRERNEDRKRGEGVDRRNVSQSYVLHERKGAPLSAAPPFSSLILPLAQGMHGTRTGKGSKRMRESNGQSGCNLLCPALFVPLNSSSYSPDAYSCQ